MNGDSPAGYLTERGLDWFFRTGPTDRMFGRVVLLGAPETAGADASKVAILYADDQQSSVIAKLIR